MKQVILAWVLAGIATLAWWTDVLANLAWD